MEIEISAGGKSLGVSVKDPFRIDVVRVTEDIREFAKEHGCHPNGLDIEGLLPLMVKGVYGCEEGCPSDAKRLVTEGYKGFVLEYIEGGILSARSTEEGSGGLTIKIFPEF